jgi:hypothetical protein
MGGRTVKGKFDNLTAEYLHHVSLEGAYAEGGDVRFLGHWCVVEFDAETAHHVNLLEANDHRMPSGRCVYPFHGSQLTGYWGALLEEDSQGFVTCTLLEDSVEADEAIARCEASYDPEQDPDEVVAVAGHVPFGALTAAAAANEARARAELVEEFRQAERINRDVLMTDKERFVGLLTDFGIHFEATDHDGNEIEIPSHGGPKNEGYGGFVAAFTFSPDGSFERVGIWE